MRLPLPVLGQGAGACVYVLWGYLTSICHISSSPILCTLPSTITCFCPSIDGTRTTISATFTIAITITKVDLYLYLIKARAHFQLKYWHASIYWFDSSIIETLITTQFLCDCHNPLGKHSSRPVSSYLELFEYPQHIRQKNTIVLYHQIISVTREKKTSPTPPNMSKDESIKALPAVGLYKQ